MIVVLNPSNGGGHSFKGLDAYCVQGSAEGGGAERLAWVETRNLEVEPEHAWKVMAATAQAQAVLKQAAGVRAGRASKNGPVLHIVMAFDEDEPTDREAMRQAADELLSVLGADPGRMRGKSKPLRRQFADEHQVVMYAHRDTGHTHLHLMVNRVHPETGINLPTSNDRLKAQKWALAYSERHGTADKTPARAENMADREKGEYVKGEKRKSRNVYELEQAIKAAANDNDRAKAVLAKQRKKSAALTLRGRNMAALHAAAWDKLAAAYRERQSALARSLRSRLAAARSEIREAFRPRWRELARHQEGELATFEALEESFFGRAANAIRTARISIHREEWPDGGYISRAFRVLGNAGERRRRFLAGQEAERKGLEREQAAAIAERSAALKTAAETRKSELRDGFLAERGFLQQRHGLEEARLKEAWRERAAERKQAIDALQAERAPEKPKSRLDDRARAILDKFDLQDDFDRGKSSDKGHRGSDQGRDDDHER